MKTTTTFTKLTELSSNYLQVIFTDRKLEFQPGCRSEIKNHYPRLHSQLKKHYHPTDQGAFCQTAYHQMLVIYVDRNSWHDVTESDLYNSLKLVNEFITTNNFHQLALCQFDPFNLFEAGRQTPSQMMSQLLTMIFHQKNLYILTCPIKTRSHKLDLGFK